MLLAAMIFENCTDDQSGNALTSPELRLLSDQELTFTMLPVPISHYSTVNVYKTSVLKHIDTLLGSFSATSSGWNISVDANVVHRICLPAGTYQLVFIASETANNTHSTVALPEVFLTDSRCTYASLAGNRLLTFKFLCCEITFCDFCI